MATATLRIVNVTINSSSSISVTFNYTLTTNLVTANVSLISQTPNVSDSQILGVSVTGAVLTISCQPMIQFAAYMLQFQNTELNPFISVNGQAQISQDGVSNKYLLTAPIDPDNPIKNYLSSFYNGNIYNIEDNTLVGQYINAISINLARALYDIRQAKNENYLSVTIIDEQQVRGNGPTDRLNEEGAYEILRVGSGPTGATVNNTFVFSDFPSYPVTLQRQENTEIVLSNSTDQKGTFNINTLTINLSNAPITKVNSIVFTLLATEPTYVYDISKLGYQIQNSEYDQDFASSFAQLSNNQIRLNEALLSDPNFALDKIFNITIQYESKNLGIVVDASTVDVYTTEQSVREVIPPIINVFSLKHAPITDSTNSIPILGGVTFTDPNNNTPGALHPAFLYEIPYSLSALPTSPGQFSVDYTKGTVYVYGADSTNDGTGPFPPLATYFYRLTYVSEIDYVYDSDALNLVALPTGSLVNSTGSITFGYEQVFIPGVDYKANIHIESINESVGNNLIALNAIRTQNSPITDVFQIYNQTSGEIYTLNRWYNNIVYFNYNTPPKVSNQVGERASFENVVNELLFINTTYTNASSLTIFQIYLNNNTIIDSTEDGTGASFNTSASFSDTNVFVSEKWYNREENVSTNVNRLINIGEYMIDYINGIVYCAVSNTQSSEIGTISYKLNSIVPQFPSIISVNDLYYRISTLAPKNKQFSYTSFGNGFIVPDGLDPSDELYLNNVSSSPYQLFNGSVGIFIGSGFLPGVTNQVKFVRSVFEYDDLLNSTSPLNFASASTSSNFNISVGSITGQAFEVVQFDGTNYYVLLNLDIPYLSPNITYDFSVIRASDSESLWDVGNPIIPGKVVKLILSITNTPVPGDLVSVTYQFTINPVSRLVVDYNKGDYFSDYTYVADELLISYEWGDNSLDFSSSNTVTPNTQYYVSYRVGALRDALLKNFGTLVNIPELSTFDINLDRERYREALQAALSSFIQGPTVPAMKNIGQIISHIEPQINESFLDSWVLGSSLLNPELITTTGTFQSLPAKFGNGALVDQSDQTIKFPANDNIRLEEGTFETWIVPQWNGLDNDAELTFNISRNGSPIEYFRVLIGPGEYSPSINNGVFTLDKNSSVKGTPNTNKDGVYIYYDLDPTHTFYQWYLEIVDGYISGSAANYQVKISSNGKFYNVKSLTPVKPSNMSLFTGVKSVNMTIQSGGQIDEGLTFISDVEHYLLDFGEALDRSRLSIFKDASGYMNFRVFDKQGINYSISANISDWKIGVAHQIAASWKLNTRNNRDELHLFIDGFEVPNISRYGQNLPPFPGENFRTVDPEEIVASVSKDIVGSDDLITVAGTNSVTSTINFSAFNISIGDILTIREIGFSANGYIITGINGQTLSLNQNMPLSITNGLFSVNQTDFVVTSEITVVPNIAVSTLHATLSGNDLSTFTGSNIVTSTGIDFTSAGVLPGYLLRIDNAGFATSYTIVQVSGNSLTLITEMPATLSNISFQVYDNSETELPGVRALHPDYAISQDDNFNNILTVYNGVMAKDLILIRTLGLNHKTTKHRYYLWSDLKENVLMTQLPPPVSLDAASITKVILPAVAIGSSNSTIIGGSYQSINFMDGYIYQPTNSQFGRTLAVTISGTNIDFSVPVIVNINGQNSVGPLTETITFNDYGTQNTVNPFISVSYINTNMKPLNASRNAGVLAVSEAYSITYRESGGLAPVVRYSYPIASGYNLFNDGYVNGMQVVTDNSNLFSHLDIGNQIIINSPITVAGFYKITGVSDDRHSLYITNGDAGFPIPLAPFSSGVYQVLNVSDYRSGLQNGFFTFEDGYMPGQAYYLRKGFYDLEYFTYLSIKFDPINSHAFIGSDLEGHNQINSIVNEMKIYDIMLTDTRIGETALATQRTITKDFNSLKSLKSDINTLMLVSFNTFPFSNISQFYIDSNTDKQHFGSSFSINDNFGQSVVIQDTPIVVSNAGILDTRKQGTIEFWVSPIYDTGNDPVNRFYFDAFGAVIEDVVSADNTSVKISAPASQILSVTLKAGDPRVDYFAGGKLEIDTQRATQEEGVSIGTGSVTVSQPILQVISVKIVGDLTGVDYFAGGAISTDLHTIYLGKPLPVPNIPLLITYQTTNKGNKTLNTQVIRLNKKLPYQNTTVRVKYIPSGLQGDRISIYKDEFGYVNFGISASGKDFIVRAPTRWTAGTWHRVKASYQVNSGIGTDNMLLFIDGYQYSDVTFGEDIIFGKFPIVMGAVTVGDGYSTLGNITFKDPVNELFIGSAYDNTGSIYSLIDNFRISNISRPIYAPYGEPLDVNYSSNQSVVFPVTSDLYTTYLLDFNSLTTLNTSFSTIVNRNTGGFDFSINIIDSFGIVSSSPLVQQILEELINVLKPANSLAVIQYTT